MGGMGIHIIDMSHVPYRDHRLHTAGTPGRFSTTTGRLFRAGKASPAPYRLSITLD
jgi:hypothetical protein